jgi:hypothetical protein
MAELREESPQEIKAWVQRRVAAVRECYSAYTCLCEKGVELPDESTPFQVSCPFHGADNTPSARYYPSEGGRHDYLRCFKCRENWDCINLIAKFNGLRFMDALADLERRFHIKIPKKPDAPEIVEPTERSSNYVSDQWQDVPRMLKLLEGKLARVRPKCSLTDYIKFCRVLDAVEWDFNKINKSLPPMSDALKKLLGRMDEVMQLPDDLSFSDFEA